MCDVTEFQKTVQDWYNEHKFIECSFKDKNDWYEVLDITSWDWHTFDYRIPNHNQPKSLDDTLDRNHSTLIDADWKR